MNQILPDDVQKTLDSLASGVGIFDVHDGIIETMFLNEGYFQMIGQPREERKQFFGTGTVMAVHPDDRAALLQEAKASIAEKRVFSARFRVLSGTGDYMWIGIRANHEPLGGKTERFYASYYNLNDLQLEKEKLNGILGNIPGGVAIFSYDGAKIRLEYTNPGFYALHHGSKEFWDKQSSDPREWLCAEDRHIFEEEFQPVLKGEKIEGSALYRITGEDGLLHWVNNQFRLSFKEKGRSFFYASFSDMDDLKDAEKERRQVQQMYEAAVKDAKLVVWEYDIIHHRIIMADNEFSRYDYSKFGLPKIIENVPESLLSFIDSAYATTFLEMYRKIDAGEPTATCEVWYRFQPGHEPRCERISYTTVFDENGKPIKAYGIGQNITGQKRDEEKFVLAYRQLDNAYPDSLGSFHLNLTKNWCGDGHSPFSFVLEQQQSGTADGYFLEFAKLIADEEIKKDFFARFSREKLLEQFSKGVEEAVIEYPIIREDGLVHWRNGLLFMIRNPKSGDVEAVTYAIDIDAKKKNQLIMSKLINENFDYIGIIHPSQRSFEFHSRRSWITYGEVGQILSYDDCVRYVSGRFVDEEEKKHFLDMTSLENVVAALKRQKGRHSFTYIRTVESKPTCSQLQYSWLDKEGGDILVIRSDVTDSYLLEREHIAALKEAKKEAEVANSAKSEFLSSMSHDMRTPLNGIIGMAYLAGEQKNPKKTKECLKKINTSSKYLLSLINDVLDMSKAESGKIVFHPEPYPLKEFNAYIDSLVMPLVKAKDQTFALDEQFAPTDLVPLADKLRTNQIIFNLLSNAIKYTPEGGKISYRISGYASDKNHLRITHTVSDNGIGMSEEFQKHLFQPFSQENRAFQSEAHGTGLGLSIVKKLVDALGGSISVYSVVGKGSTFTVTLEFEAISNSSLIHEKDKKKGVLKEKNTLKGKRILLCEDNALNQEIAKAVLSEKGAIVFLASNGQDGITTFVSSPEGSFDCILMDIHMPVMDGYSACREIRALPRVDAKKVPIIAMTADAFQEDIDKCLEAGMNGHIAKPIDPHQTIATIASFLK